MIVSNNKKLLDYASFLAVQAKTDPLRFIHDEIGYNYRLTNISAAYGVSQINHIYEFIKTKKENYFYYKNSFENNGLEILDFNPGTKPNYWFYSLIIDEDSFGLDNEKLMLRLQEYNIQTRPIWGLIHEQKPYNHSQNYQIEKAKYYVKRVLNIPCSTNLTKNDIDYVVETIKSIGN